MCRVAFLPTKPVYYLAGFSFSALHSFIASSVFCPSLQTPCHPPHILICLIVIWERRREEGQRDWGRRTWGGLIDTLSPSPLPHLILIGSLIVIWERRRGRGRGVEERRRMGIGRREGRKRWGVKDGRIVTLPTSSSVLLV